ncbi:DNA translocase FtsK [Puniceicoccus vermicola]|uniref:DNA translocase FtsK 4TM domain-containing protein n=1 Tax=Puniceicoccus vermicola TaxID=388746 RepID=A0A7X1E5A9_9BACT|nr:DNA translocase FtsK [Puniceicoccus vermicola]MBC2602838.1 DNA translocase FtsK 4TM domain-containing protein [Puniceicoccus vermicola]
MSPSRQKKNKKVQATFTPRTSPIRPLKGGILITIGLLFAVALVDYDPTQEGIIRAFATSTETSSDPNLVGQFGRDSAFLLLSGLGLGSVFLLFSVIWIGVLNLVKRAHLVTGPRLVVLVLATLASAGLANGLQLAWWPNLESIFPENFFPRGTGGLAGYWLNEAFLFETLGQFGSFFLLLLFFLLGLGALFSDPSRNLFERAFQRWSERRADRQPTAAERKKARTQKREERAQKIALKEEKRQAKLDRKKEKDQIRQEKAQKREEREAERRQKREAEAAAREERLATRAKEDPEPESESVAAVDSSLLSGSIPARRRSRSQSRPEPAAPARRATPPTEPEPEPEPEPAPQPKPAKAPEPKEPEPKDSGLKIVAGEKIEKAENLFPARKGNYQFPSLDLLQEPTPPQERHVENHEETAMALKTTLAEFGVKVELGEVHTGPVITRYEVYPAPGVRVEKIANLAKNLGMSLKAQSVRILAPVPGKGCVGVEVPNRNPSAVCIREIIESRSWGDADAEIPVVLGKEVSGKPLVADLTKMPHLLIAGSTGSGKTVCINSVIASLLYHSSPEDLRFIMIDPKIVEMQIYNSLPHMLIPVVTDPKKVPGALKWLISEMERRYQVFARANVRNIAGFNSKIAKNKEEKKRAEEMEAEMSAEERNALLEARSEEEDDGFEMPTEKIPYIVCIVDELADLMMVAPADIETGIARLAQLARAAGIHLILATQRPSVNVITGVIKANLPSRIAFKVASKIDSRTILDEGGADSLIGKGDMLFIPPGAHTLVRAQGAFVSDEEINGVVEYLKVNGPPNFLEQVQAQIDAGDEEGGGGAEGDYEDELVPQALDVLRSSKRASTSMLQRRLRIGYNRAARIMEILEDEGYVGPENGSSPREILRDLD